MNNAEKVADVATGETAKAVDADSLLDSPPQQPPTSEATAVAANDLLNPPAPEPPPVAVPVATPAPEPPPVAPAAPAAEPTNVVQLQPEPQPYAERSGDWKCPACGKPWEFRSHLVRHVEKAHREQAADLLAKIPQGSKGGPRAWSARPAATPAPVPDFTDITTAEAVEKNYQVQAEVAFDLGTGTLAMIFGNEWRAKTPEERSAVVEAVKAYMKAKNMQDIPPGWMLTIVICAYAAPRFREPSTADKIKAAWTWGKSKIAGYMSRRKKV